MPAQSNHPRADWEADEKRRPLLITGKDEEEEEELKSCTFKSKNRLQ
jgi:hypothetical protein